MKVPFVDTAAQFSHLRHELTEAFITVGQSGMYVQGKQIEEFEVGLATLCGTEYALSTGNGTDALVLALKALDIGPGDEVITAPNSFIASAGAISNVGASIRFADVGDDYNIDPGEIAKAITPKTKAIMPVHLTGNPADMEAITTLAQNHNLYVIEDAAQAINATYKGSKIGSLGDIACFSLHPLKNLHVMGDAGFITTSNQTLRNRIEKLRNHGLKNRNESVEWGLNSRCDTLQAAIGLVKLKHIEDWTHRFRSIAHLYKESLSDIVDTPNWRIDDDPVFHNFVIQVDDRDTFMDRLLAKGVDTKIHYPIPLHLMEAAIELPYEAGSFPNAELQANRIVSLPIYPELTDQQVKYVVDSIKEIVGEKC